MTTAAAIDNLPDSDFGYIESGGKVSDGRTEPRSLRHFPIQDAAHVRNALARIGQSPFGEKARAKVEAAARRLGIGAPAGKAFFDMKAETLTKSRISKWLDGEIGRRLLVVPFGGPIPADGTPGLDQDDEFFDAATDIYGPYPSLKATPWRVMDWHHDDIGVPAKSAGGPALSMKGMVIGEIELDEDPDEFGHWAQWWIKQGHANEQRIAAKRVAALQEMGQPVWGSSQALYRQKADNGHIEVWPIIRHTATTSPRNNAAVVPSLKALLADPSLEDLSGDAIKALILGLDAETHELLLSSPDAAVTASALAGDGAVKAGRVISRQTASQLRAAITLLSDLIAQGALLPDSPFEDLSSD